MRDDAELILGLLADVVGNRALVTSLQATLYLGTQPRLFGVPVGHGKLRHQVGSLVEGNLAPLRNEQCVVACLGEFGPHRTHLGSGLQVEVPGVKSKPLGVVHRCPRSDAQQHLVGIRIRLVHVMQIIGGHQRQLQVPCDANEVFSKPPLNRQPVVHDLAEVVFRTENVAKIGRGSTRLLVLTRLQPAIDLPAGAPGRTDQPGTEPIEQLSVEARLVVMPFEAGQRRQAEEVVHAQGGFRPYRHVGVIVFASAGAWILRRSLVEPSAEIKRSAFGSTLGRVIAL